MRGAEFQEKRGVRILKSTGRADGWERAGDGGRLCSGLDGLFWC